MYFFVQRPQRAHRNKHHFAAFEVVKNRGATAADHNPTHFAVESGSTTQKFRAGGQNMLL
jgi:hypothetical protein